LSVGSCRAPQLFFVIVVKSVLSLDSVGDGNNGEQVVVACLALGG